VQRHDRGAIGLITTHDLALTAVADELSPRAANVHFEDWLEGDEIRFVFRTKNRALMRRTLRSTPLARELAHLVALDGSRLAEASLGPALALSDPRNRHVTLLQVISPLAPGLHERRRRALAYLLRIAGGLEERGIAVDVQVLARAHAGRAVADYTDLIGADLVAVATRERGVARRAALGSMADTAVRRGRAPILICHSPTKPRATADPKRRHHRSLVG